ncbi:MAG: Crp/Fnr family transcriptional regulator [bacterium]
MKREDMLRKVEIFSDLNDRLLRALANACTEQSYAEGETLVKQGEGGVGIFFITSGKVKVVKETSGGEKFDVAVMGPGEFFGEMSVLDDAPRSASVIAEEDTKCLILTSWDFRGIMKNHPEIALGVLPVVVKRFRETNAKLLELGRA